MGSEVVAMRRGLGDDAFATVQSLGFDVKILENEIADRVAANAKTRILLVEDEAPVRLLMWHILNRAGYTVLLGTDGVDGLRKLSEAGHIDLLITDLAMPGMTGLELAQRASEILPCIKIIYASGSHDCFPETRADIHCLRKPFTVDELLEAVRNGLDRDLCAR
jgi:CheY-like chemotaxis protein